MAAQSAIAKPPDGDERNRVNLATQRVSGSTKSARDKPGDGAAELQPRRRAITSAHVRISLNSLECPISERLVGGGS
jgi:hypothetical protein